MGQPGKVQTTLLTPVDVVKAEWLSKAKDRTPEMLAAKPPRPKVVEVAKDLPEYIVDPGTKTTYVKGKFLGKGGFARVHELTDLTSSQVYACKIIPKSRLTKPHQKEKILREIELHQQLVHPHIVRFHHFFEDERSFYILLENCSRKSLVHMLRNRVTLTEAETRYFMRQLAEGVRHVHSCGVLHRDLKLGNMLLADDMSLRVGDFGLAAHAAAIADCGRRAKLSTVCGTPNYIAPEVLSMQGHCYASDVWAMGCIMYAMLVGQPPFETATLNETYTRISNSKYVLPPGVSEPARQLISKMLQLRPQDRPSLDDILRHRFFTAGPLPAALPPACCVTAPRLPLGPLRRSISEHDVDKIANRLSCVTFSPKSDAPKNRVKSEENSPRKDNCFPSNIRQKLTNVLCPDKIVKKPKVSSSSASMHQMLSDALEAMPEGEEGCADPAPYPGVASSSPFISKWVDYSNKYGFAFQLSDRSFGVIFNDATRMAMTANRNKVQFHEASGKCHTYSCLHVPAEIDAKLTLFKYFADYMDENLSDGGEVQHAQPGHPEAPVRRKMPYMKRWLRTSYAVVMQLSSGTLQINFFKDHTKLVLGCNEGVTLIDEERRSSWWPLSTLQRQGCSATLAQRLHYAASVLRDFARLEGDLI